ncbi:SWF or SNF family helicase [Streptomyces sp. ID05-04B]|uniref:SWF or SNF family helicase n=1 Tax=unclassified Streptomyces TaxID=2593676 RepID=UPI000D1B382D|nr:MULTISPECIES: SWF or SNF family helicase [unclassified Streptomyces]AVV47944.1 SWF or SNF family helicase [Streptomyces sp. P3]MDX5562670.1 SWF or SNF family helicase [Streptomyces sp. ID05-04B]
MARIEEHTFAALPPAHGRGFAQTWWGRAWLTALEDGAMDGEQVRAGRRLARAGSVGAVTVRPGRITAVVRGRDRTPHRADVLLDTLSAAQWDRFLDLTAEQAGHTAALLDGEMPPHLVEDADAAGVHLLPGLGDLEAACDCGAWDHCGHTAALCYQVARLLDQDPFVLLLLRGRSERVLLDGLQERGAGAPAVSASAASRAEGVDAAEAYAAGDILPALPAAPPLPPEPGIACALDTDAPAPPGVEPAALEYLAARTAAAAHLLLSQALRERPGPGAEPWRLSVAQDAVRLASGAVGSIQGAHRLAAVAGRLAVGSGRSREQLASAVRAWQHGGPAALSVLEEEWAVEGDALARARAALQAAWEDDERPALRARANRWTVAGEACQLRLGRDGRWWPYREEGGRWMPAGDADDDPATALAAALPDRGEAPSRTETRSPTEVPSPPEVPPAFTA